MLEVSDKLNYLVLLLDEIRGIVCFGVVYFIGVMVCKKFGLWWEGCVLVFM